MKKLIRIKENLTKEKEKLDALIEHREDYYNERTFEWQESDRGENYLDNTSELETVRDDLDSLIDNFDDVINNF